MAAQATSRRTATKGTAKTELKQGVKLVKLATLGKGQLAKLNLNDLWVISPGRSGTLAPPRLCGCRSVCLA